MTGGGARAQSISIIKAHGRSSLESELVHGFALNCTRCSQQVRGRLGAGARVLTAPSQMPTHVEPARIALLDFNLRKHRMQLGVQILVTDPKARAPSSPPHTRAHPRARPRACGGCVCARVLLLLLPPRARSRWCLRHLTHCRRGRALAGACAALNLPLISHTSAFASVTRPQELEAVRQRESDITKEKIQMLLAAGANVILTTKTIDDTCMKCARLLLALLWVVVRVCVCLCVVLYTCACAREFVCSLCACISDKVGVSVCMAGCDVM